MSLVFTRDTKDDDLVVTWRGADPAQRGAAPDSDGVRRNGQHLPKRVRREQARDREGDNEQTRDA